MRKFLFLSVLTFFFLPPAFSQDFKKSLMPAINSSVVYVASCDWGPCIEKIVINTGKKLSPQAIKAKDFEINQILYPKSTNTGIIKNSLEIIQAYSSDAYGAFLDVPSNFITLVTDLHPLSENTNPFVKFSFSSHFKNYYGYKITNRPLDIKITSLSGFVNEIASKFNEKTFSWQPSEFNEEKLNLSYMTCLPDSKEKIPLILWFHGMGESGTNPYQILFGTKAAVFADDVIQKYFKNGAAILAPQCPTGWLESTEKGPGGVRLWAPVDPEGSLNKIKKPINNFLDKFFVFEDNEASQDKDEGEKSAQKEKFPYAAVSYYTLPVKALLDAFLEEHPQIDRERIYVGGCSAGGYMTMNMMIQYPEVFAAAFPVCEYYLDSKITDSQIKSLSEKALWFTYALNDQTVKPEKTSIPTIKRLREAGAKNLHISEFRNVVDLSGRYLMNRDADKDDDDYGLPYEYDGHESWIYLFNDKCREDGLSLFQWLSKQKL
ncbi:MAG: prolyl oligopeptidase family serine peptidase [Treponema sp.]|nr:prolyl oligopeptidase family serine peptidase [Treponema sp.]